MDEVILNGAKRCMLGLVLMLCVQYHKVVVVVVVVVLVVLMVEVA